MLFFYRFLGLINCFRISFFNVDLSLSLSSTLKLYAKYLLKYISCIFPFIQEWEMEGIVSQSHMGTGGNAYG